jgi:hypothetical protein
MDSINCYDNRLKGLSVLAIALAIVGANFSCSKSSSPKGNAADVGVRDCVENDAKGLAAVTKSTGYYLKRERRPSDEVLAVVSAGCEDACEDVWRRESGEEYRRNNGVTVELNTFEEGTYEIVKSAGPSGNNETVVGFQSFPAEERIYAPKFHQASGGSLRVESAGKYGEDPAKIVINAEFPVNPAATISCDKIKDNQKRCECRDRNGNEFTCTETLPEDAKPGRLPCCATRDGRTKNWEHTATLKPCIVDN